MITIPDQSKRAASLFRFESQLLPQSDQMWALAGKDCVGVKAAAVCHLEERPSAEDP
jgi:hypothetical protein